MGKVSADGGMDRVTDGRVSAAREMVNEWDVCGRREKRCREGGHGQQRAVFLGRSKWKFDVSVKVRMNVTTAEEKGTEECS